MRCRFCKFTSSSQGTLLKHFRLHHRQGAHWPCIHISCVCVFKTHGALRSHLSRSHSTVKVHENSTFQCELCDFKEICSEKSFWNHLGHHLKNRETVQCPFLGEDEDGSPFTLKKPRRGEVNHVPDYPEHNDDSTLEEERVAVVDEMKKKQKNMTVIKQKMALTFSLRRREVVEGQPMVSEVRERWPALFSADEVRLY